jgi:hypothetical protein
MTPKVIEAAATTSAPGGRPARPRQSPGLVVALGLASALAGPACNFGESGVPPPSDQLFLPTGIAIDPDGQWLYVVNSNFDLRYNAGTVTAVNLRRVAEDKAAAWTLCPTPGYLPPAAPARACCYDFFDHETLNCNDRNYIDPSTTVRTGSFGGAMVIDPHPKGDPAKDPAAPPDLRRLFVLVRAEPSVTFIDSIVSPDRVSLHCTDAAAGPDKTCDDSWKVQGSRDTAVTYALQEEPYAFALDEQLRILYVGHLFSGVSALDLCSKTSLPVLGGVNPRVFSSLAEGDTSLTLTQPGNPMAPLFATSHTLTSAGFSEIRPLYLRAGAELDPGTGRSRLMDCPASGASRAKNDLELVPGVAFFSSAFFPSGRDLRGLVQSPDGKKLFVLHRNTGTRDNPAALVAIDRTPDRQGNPVNRATDAVEICGGASQLSWHDTGRGPRLFVVCFESGQVYVVDPDLLIVSAIINAGRGPTTLAFSPTDPKVAYLSGFSDNNVSVIDLQPGSPTEYRVVQRIGFPHSAGQ